MYWVNDEVLLLLLHLHCCTWITWRQPALVNVEPAIEDIQCAVNITPRLDTRDIFVLVGRFGAMPGGRGAGPGCGTCMGGACAYDARPAGCPAR
jgi:hypothetical protein